MTEEILLRLTESKTYRAFALLLLPAAFVYGLVLPFCWGNNPAEVHGTLSLLCENHIPAFWIWTLLTGGAFTTNLLLVYDRFGETRRLPRICLFLSMLGMALTAATLNHSIENWNPKRVLHWLGAILYAAGLAAAFLLFYFKQMRSVRRLIPFVVVSVLLLVSVLVQLLIFDRNGYMEIIPIAAYELELFLLNYTGLVRPKVRRATAG